MKKISVIIPCYNEDKNVFAVYKALTEVIYKNRKYDFELIFVDNGSIDETKKEIYKLSKKNRKVKGIFLSRNFGPESSVKAGIDLATGDAFSAIAADLQDPPELISNFIRKWEQGFDVIFGTYVKTEDGISMVLIRKMFYKLFKITANINIPANVSGFGLFDKKVLTALKGLNERYRFGRSLVSWLGFKIAYVPYKRHRRMHGKSSYSFFDYIKHAERGIFGFSYLPLDMLVYGGFFLTIFSFLFIVGYLYWVIVFGNPIKASIPLMLAIVFFGGINLFGISILGKYIQVIVEETKARPIYIVEETINIKNNQ